MEIAGIVSTLLSVLDQLLSLRAAASARDLRILDTILTPIVQDMEGVHRDYLAMFAATRDSLPYAWEPRDEHYSRRVAMALASLKARREQFGPVRARLVIVLHQLRDIKANAEQRKLLRAVMDYFPCGVLMPKAVTTGVPRFATASGIVAAELQKELTREMQADLRHLLDETIDHHKKAWARVCRCQGRALAASTRRRGRS